MKETIFSGIQPTGNLHIGNYLGAVKQFVEMQAEYNSIFCVVDYHSITEDFKPDEKREQILTTAAEYLACGIDPNEAVLFVQSDVRGHTELAWIFNCITPLSEMERMTQYKDKALRQKSNINMGLVDYPVLMAADILLYHADLVPVGEDQVQHIELTRKIVRKFNHKFGQYFKEPKVKLNQAARIMSLTMPDKKMSKSMGVKSYIALCDGPDLIREKISKAVTDTGKSKSKMGGGRNLLDLFNLFVGDSSISKKFEDDYKNGELQYAKFKPMLVNVIINSLKPIRQKRARLLQDKDYIIKVLAEGAKKVSLVADKTMNEVKKLVGLV